MADGKLTFARTTDSADAGELHLGEWGGAQPTLQNGLLFRNPASGNAKLVFGYTVDPGAADVPDAEFGIDADLDSDASASITLAVITALGIDATFDDEMPATISLAWDANVSRSLLARVAPAWQEAAPCTPLLRSHWQDAGALSVARAVHWQRAAALAGSARMHWQASLGLQAGTRAAWQLGRGITADLRAAFEEARSLRAGARPYWQRGLEQSIAPRIGFQQMLALTAPARAHWQRAMPLLPWWALHNVPALRVPTSWQLHWQDARVPSPGGTPRPPPPQPPGKPICYDPERLGLLVFRQPAGTAQHGTLFFICTKSGPPPEPPGRWAIPTLEVYVSTHAISAVTLPGEEPVALLDCQIETDDGGFCWSFSANGPEHLLDQLAPVAGLPARMRVTIDGIDWVFAVESVSRTRRFGQHRCAIQGRSITALLGAPYSPEQSWLSTATADASQILADALEYTTTSVDWQITDWQIPAGAWSHSGTPLTAALRIAESVGAVLRSHRTLQELIYAPRYPYLPWEWADAIPDVEMPAAIITTDSLQPASTPAYDSVYVSGMAQGVLGHVVRTGYPGDLPAPQVTDALITDTAAARQRGQAVLGAAGNKLTQTMTLPLLTGGSYPGLILPGYLLKVNDIGHTWRGLVRSIRISAGMPTVRQTISVERQA